MKMLMRGAHLHIFLCWNVINYYVLWWWMQLSMAGPPCLISYQKILRSKKWIGTPNFTFHFTPLSLSLFITVVFFHFPAIPLHSSFHSAHYIAPFSLFQFLFLFDSHSVSFILCFHFLLSLFFLYPSRSFLFYPSFLFLSFTYWLLTLAVFDAQRSKSATEGRVTECNLRPTSDQRINDHIFPQVSITIVKFSPKSHSV